MKTNSKSAHIQKFLRYLSTEKDASEHTVSAYHSDLKQFARSTQEDEENFSFDLTNCNL
ncbi:MAG: site-specific integrase, partial [Lentisphaeria bacterium]|nr:site-specific integrase [Lentisphaeria bacterium]